MTQIINIRTVYLGTRTTEPIVIKRIMKKNYKYLYSGKFENLVAMDQFLKNHKGPKHNKDEIYNPITTKNIEFAKY